MGAMAAKMVLSYMESRDLKAGLVKENLLRAGWNFEGGHVDIFVQFDESDTHVHVEGINFAKIPQDKYDIMYKVLNECNDTYTHVKFVLDTENGQINARDDDVIQLDSCGEECVELILRMVRVIEDAYPKFMKALWA